jgi:hypothetical protein
LSSGKALHNPDTRKDQAELFRPPERQSRGQATGPGRPGQQAKRVSHIAHGTGIESQSSIFDNYILRWTSHESRQPPENARTPRNVERAVKERSSASRKVKVSRRIAISPCPPPEPESIKDQRDSLQGEKSQRRRLDVLTPPYPKLTSKHHFSTLLGREPSRRASAARYD